MSSLPSPHLLALGRRLRQMRRARELSQEALAALANVHPKHLSEIERANKDPRATTVIRLADALGVPVSQLYEDEAPGAAGSVTRA